MKNVTFIEGFTETLSQDKLRKDVFGERLTHKELMSPYKAKRIPIDRAMVLAKRKERKKQEYLDRIGVSYDVRPIQTAVSIRDCL